jgi:predicted dehydrogenase
MHKKILLIGAGSMAESYFSVLKSLHQKLNVSVIGRGEKSANSFESATGISVIRGGIKSFLRHHSMNIPEVAIVSVSIPELSATTHSLLQAGCRSILLEKPGGINSSEIHKLADFAEKYESTVVLAYNRRFYESVRIARAMLHKDGGPSSFTFEFTEWGHIIAKLNKSQVEFDNWLLANSSHVIDLAFFLGGLPAKIQCFTSGRLPWHKHGAVFCGSGKTDRNVPFSYHADWQAPGRWGVQVLSKTRRYILCPLETLRIQEIGNTAIKEVPLDDHLDKEFKPGLYRQVSDFLEGYLDDFVTLREQAGFASLCDTISGKWL